MSEVGAYPWRGRDLNILALTIFGEARGEGFAGKLAVGWTVRNRAEADLHHDGRPDWWGEGIAGCALKSWQYSCWNLDDQPQSQRARLLRLLVDGDLVKAALTGAAAADGAVAECVRAAQLVLDGGQPDPTGGGTHYYATWVAEPAWARGHAPSAVIGPHRFYADVEPGYEAAQPPRADPTGGRETPVLHLGARCDAVKTLQHILNHGRQGWPGAGLVVDGIFGGGTDGAVRRWQRAHGLWEDGIVGPATWASLDMGK